MQPELPRTSLNGSALVGLLAQLALVDRPLATPSFVAGLGHWLSWKEAIPLSSALQAPLGAGRHAAQAGGPRQAATTTSAVVHDFAQLRDALARAIADEATTAREDGASFVPFRRRYFGLQQSMQAVIGPLRVQARAAVARLAPSMNRLAALDAVMADALAAHEQALLALMPVLLEKHFTRLRQVPQPAAPGTPWLEVFRADMQRLLLAELELRLQPVLGLLDTLLDTPLDTPLNTRQAAQPAPHQTS